MKRKDIFTLIIIIFLSNIIIVSSLFGEGKDDIECQLCGKKNSYKNTFCSFCGVRLTIEEKIVDEDTVEVDLSEKLYQEGVNFVLAGNYTVAIGLFEKILEEYPDSPYAEYADPLHKACRELITVHDDLVKERIKNITKEKALADEKKKDVQVEDLIKKSAKGCGSLLLVIIAVGLFSCIF